MDSSHFRGPARFSPSWFARFEGGVDPAARVQLANETAHALLARVRGGEDTELVARVVRVAKEDGIDAIVELWADSAPHTLPGTLWRVHLVHALVTQRAEETARLYQAGADALPTAAPIIAGVAAPAEPDEVTSLVDSILRGVFAGDFALALERAAAFALVTAHGAVLAAHEAEASRPTQAASLTRLSASLTDIAAELRASARLWRAEALD